MRNLRDSKGFTLIELMIVVVIIGILAAIAIPKFNNVSQSAKEAEADPVLKQLCSLAESEFLKDNEWPTTQDSVPGWVAPTSQRYSFGSADSIATATAQAGHGLHTKTMNCVNKQITQGAVVS